MPFRNLFPAIRLITGGVSSIGGVTQFGMSCTGRNTSTNQAAGNFQVSLGNAGIS